MARDAQDNVLTTASEEAARAFDHAVEGYIGFRADTAQRLGTLLVAAPELGMAHLLKGYLSMVPSDAAFVPRARQALTDAQAHLAHATLRERAHVQALAQWIDGDIDRAMAVWEQILAEHPRDVLAFRLHHTAAFWCGRPEQMLAVVNRARPHWSASVPAWGAVLACRAFANEECGNYAVAEASGREAIALDAGNLWATHALAHVMEMQGRADDGVAFLEQMEQHWSGGNAIKHHLWWHCAMYHLERREFDAVFDLYDRRFRDLASPLVVAMPDFMLDVQNAASMLLRLELRGVSVGERWVELADKAEARIGDWLSPFTVPHRMMALAAAGRWQAAERMLEALCEVARSARANATSALRDAAVPVCEAVLAHRRGDFAGAVAAMRPVLGTMRCLGGSHAQQEVFEQLFVDAAMKADSEQDVRMLLEWVAHRHPVTPGQRAGYAEAARRFGPTRRAAPVPSH